MLPLTGGVFEYLKEKPQEPERSNPSAMMVGEIPFVDPAQY